MTELSTIERREFIREHEQRSCDLAFQWGAVAADVWLGTKVLKSPVVAATGFGAGVANVGVDALLFQNDHIRNAERSFTIAADFLLEPVALMVVPGAMWKRAAVMVGLHVGGRTLDRLFQTQL